MPFALPVVVGADHHHDRVGRGRGRHRAVEQVRRRREAVAELDPAYEEPVALGELDDDGDGLSGDQVDGRLDLGAAHSEELGAGAGRIGITVEHHHAVDEHPTPSRRSGRG